MVGDAVKVTEVPEQIVVAEAVMLTNGVRRGFTVIVIVLLTAVGDVMHAAFDVSVTLIISPLMSELSE